jgi:Ser-tRNA(Ala) deacylase AlaX
MSNQIIEESLQVDVLETDGEWIIKVEVEVQTTNMVKVAHRLHSGETLLAGQANFVMKDGIVKTEITINKDRVDVFQEHQLRTELHDMSKDPSERITQQLERPIQL